MTAYLRAPQCWAFDPHWCRVANCWGEHRDVRRFFAIISRAAYGWFWFALMVSLALFFWNPWRAGGSADAGNRGGWINAVPRAETQNAPVAPHRSHVGVVARLSPLDEYSFPSGHTLHAVSFRVVAIGWFSMLAPPLILFTVLVAISRVVLGPHCPTDIIAGAVLGATLGILSLWLGPMLPVAML